MENSKLSQLLEEIEEIDANRKSLLEDKNELLKAAEGFGYPKPVVRNILQRRQKERDEVLQNDAQLRQFEEELGMEVLK